MAWAPSFAALLDRPVRKTGWLPFITGLETAGGDFQGRPVLLALHHKRGRNSLGYLVVAMQPGRGSIRKRRRHWAAAHQRGANGAGPSWKGRGPERLVRRRMVEGALAAGGFTMFPGTLRRRRAGTACCWRCPGRRRARGAGQLEPPDRRRGPVKAIGGVEQRLLTCDVVETSRRTLPRRGPSPSRAPRHRTPRACPPPAGPSRPIAHASAHDAAGCRPHGGAQQGQSARRVPGRPRQPWSRIKALDARRQPLGGADTHPAARRQPADQQRPRSPTA